MSGLARLLLQLGHRVTGSDMAPNGGMKELQKLGARIHSGHAGQNISEGTELVVYTSAVGGENVELQAAAELKIPRVRRGLLLSALMNHPNNIAVAGTHGKTTTTAMIAYVLTRSDSAPSYCVGAHVPVLGTNAQIGGGKYFVAEADESDGTLVGFSPEYSVCLNIEPEHLDHYGSMEKLRETFESFFTSTHKTVFLCADCANCLALAPRCRAAITFGLSPKADYRALKVEQTKCGSRFTVSCRDQEIGVVELTIPAECKTLPMRWRRSRWPTSGGARFAFRGNGRFDHPNFLVPAGTGGTGNRTLSAGPSGRGNPPLGKVQR